VKEPFLAVDPRGTNIHEDAFRVHKARGGSFMLEIAVVDTTSCGDEVIKDVLERVHEPNESKPLHAWPNERVAERFSFLPNRSTPALVISTKLSSDLQVIEEPKLRLSRIRSVALIDYAEVPRIIQDRNHPFSDELNMAAYITGGLRQIRMDHGATGLVRLSPNEVTNEEGLIRTVASNVVLAYSIVGEFTGHFNTVAGEFCYANQGIPTLYSHQGKGVDPKSVNLARVMSSVDAPSPRRIEEMRQLLGVGLRRARYRLTPRRYHAFGVPVYAKHSAPARRTVAFFNTHNLVAALKGKQPTFDEKQGHVIANALNNQTRRKERIRAVNGKLWTPAGRQERSWIARLRGWAADMGLLQPKFEIKSFTTETGTVKHLAICHFHGFAFGAVENSRLNARQAAAKAVCNHISI